MTNLINKLIFLLSISGLSVLGQITNIPTNVQIKNIPSAINTNYQYTNNFTSGTSIPSTCTPTTGVAFYKTDTKIWYDCTDTNTFTARAPLNNPNFTGNVTVGSMVPGGAPSGSTGSIKYYGDGSSMSGVNANAPMGQLSWGPGSIASGASASNTFVLMGASKYSPLAVSSVLPAGFFAMASVSISNVVQITVVNLSGTTANPGTGIYTVSITH